MEEIVRLSELLEQGVEWLEALRSKRSNLLHNAERRRAFSHSYTQWCDASRAILPDDLRVRFEQELSRLPALPDPEDEHSWSHYGNLPYIIEEQNQQLFLARRRLWQPNSSLLNEIRDAIAVVFRNTYEIYTIDKLFVASGCEQHWYIPMNGQNTGSKAMNRALGWLDGILLYAPERERAILYHLSESILDNKRLSQENRDRLEHVLPLLRVPTSADPLLSYNFHPTVRNIAAPLVAIAHYDEAILKVCIALNNAVQARVNRPDLDGSSLMQQVFTPRGAMLTLSADSTEQMGWMQLFTGAIQALRNPRAHKLGHATSLQETIEWLGFLSALFRTLDQAQP